MSSKESSSRLTGTAKAMVTEHDLAVALGSGDVAVLGTPRMIALAEAATVCAIASALEPGQTSVGTRIDVRHLAATPIGKTVTATATLAESAGRMLRFAVEVHDDYGVVGEGIVERAIVDKAKFESRANLPR